MASVTLAFSCVLPISIHTILPGNCSVLSSSYGIKIVEGKDCPKKADGTWAFLSKYERMGYSKTIDLLLDMIEPIHRTGKVITGNSGFCIAMGVMALQKFGVNGQLLIKKRKYWRKPFPVTTSQLHGDKAIGPHGDVCSSDGRTTILGALHQRSKLHHKDHVDAWGPSQDSRPSNLVACGRRVENVQIRRALQPAQVCQAMS